MLSALSWIALFIVVLVGIMYLREQVRDNNRLQDWYVQNIKFRLGLVKKIVVYGTLFIWIAIWAFTRGDEKASFGNLMKEISSSWEAPQEIQETE